MRKSRGYLSITIVCLTLTVIVFNTDKLVVQEVHLENVVPEILPNNFTQSTKYVTPSLAELGRRGIQQEGNDHVLMLTRIPGAGSELLVLILQRLQGTNAFKHIRLPPGDAGFLTSLQQELFVEEITNIIRQEAIPLTFDGDVRFLNFSAFDRQAPTYVSLARDPLNPRMLERFKKGGLEALYPGAIPHFCGQDPRCSIRNNKWAFNRAKDVVDKWYPVVGILEEMELTLTAFESTFPYFFTGASKVYEKIRLRKKLKKSNKTISLKALTRKRLGEILADEVEFYQWLKSRLMNKTLYNG